MRALLLRILAFVRQTLRIEDVADQTAVVDFVKRDVDFRGAKAWILMFAVLVASLGLNVNSTAVIIGAMLISPLMGPIIGIGVSVGIADSVLLGRSARNLAIAMFLSIITSTLYFTISPFDDAASEILSRTTPTLLDALIAIAGGAAGAVAMVRQDRSNVVPGVAIATALMPPLCTAGYGISQLQWDMFFGAFYLFFINSVYISAATYVVVRIMKFRPVSYENPEKRRKVRRIVYAVVILTMIPSIYTGFNMYQRTRFDRRVVDLVKYAEEKFPQTSFVVSKSKWDRDTSDLVLTLVGPALKDEELTTVRTKALAIGLRECRLDLRQAAGVSDVMMTQATEQMRKNVMGDLYDRTLYDLARKDSIIAAMENQQEKRQAAVDVLKDVSREVEQINPNVESITYQDSMFVHGKEGALDTLQVAYVSFNRRPRGNEMADLQNWLRVRLKRDCVVVRRIVD